ncbi:hypothetical protein D3C77_695380 [compost metagenome]
MGQAGLPEVHLIVDHSRQQPQAVRLDHALPGKRLQGLPDTVDAALAQPHIGRPGAAFVDQGRVADQPGIAGYAHGVSSSVV